MQIQRSSRGELIAGLALLLSLGIYWASNSERQGAIAKAQEFNTTLLAQRNRENDQLERRVEAMEIALRKCNP